MTVVVLVYKSKGDRSEYKNCCYKFVECGGKDI